MPHPFFVAIAIKGAIEGTCHVGSRLVDDEFAREFSAI